MNQFSDNLKSVNARIAAAADRSGRTPEEITLIAVTKYVDASVTAALVDAGATDLGENRPQVLWDKAAALSEKHVRWHLIGHLQRNKVKRTIEHTALIHSVDSTRLLNSINAAANEANRTVNVLLEVNVSAESAKHGFSTDKLADAIEYATSCRNVNVKGLMCMAGLDSNEVETGRQFDSLRELRDNLASHSADNINLRELSMGMSGDFERAIEAGATMVRVGSLLFA